jgi:SAM-dependent methyltransferase
MTDQPRVLWACPTWSGGEYALKQWAEAWRAQTYPGVGAFMVDNSEEHLHYAHAVRAHGIPCQWLTYRHPYLWDTLERCWVGPGGIIEYAHENGYDYVFSLEHDVIVTPEATALMVAASQEYAKDGKVAVVSHRYHPRGQDIEQFNWDTLGCSLFPVQPLYEDRLLAKATYEIEAFIVCKRYGHPRHRAKALFTVEHLKDPEDNAPRTKAATPAYDLYAQRKIDFNKRKEEAKKDEAVTYELNDKTTPPTVIGSDGSMTTMPESGEFHDYVVKQLTAEPAKLVGSAAPKPAEVEVKPKVKIKTDIPEFTDDEPIGLQFVKDKAELDELLSQPRIRLNLGCGYQQIAGFIGVDFDESLDPDVVSPIDDLSWLPDNSVDMIYASHCLEHLEYEQSKKALREWLRVLKPAGWLDVMVPDINEVYVLYKKGAKWGDYSQPIDEVYINATAFGANLLADAIPEMADMYGGPGHQHKQIFIGGMLNNRLLECGYVEVHEVQACFLRASSLGETMAQARKAWFTEGSEPLPEIPPLKE